MDIFDENILGLWKALADNEVKYILIGGYAINFHGYQRFTGDLDIWLYDTLDNRKAIRKAFVDCKIGRLSNDRAYAICGRLYTISIE